MNEHYRALTRAYRPQTFEDIVSQDHVSSTLRNAIRNNRLSHAYMFCGPRGVGKTTMARVLAREVNQVDKGVDGEALSSTLNIVEMDAASNRKIEDIRALKEVIRVPPQNGRYKIFIIDEVHMLTKEAFNALLKTLEEPPEHAIFIFATTEPHKVLPTILSRVQRFDFKRISVDEIVKRLHSIAEREKIGIDEESLHVIARRSDGALRDALGLMDQAIAFCGTNIRYEALLKALNVVGVEDLFSFTELIRDGDAGRGLKMIDELIRAGTDIQEFLVSLAEHLRNLYVACQSDRLYLVEATGETRDRYQQHAVDFEEQDLMRMLHLVSETQQKLKDTRQPRVQFEMMLLKLVHMNRSRDLGALLDEVRELKKKVEDGELTLPLISQPSHSEPSDNSSGQPADKPEPVSVSDPEIRQNLNSESDEEDPFGRPSLGLPAGGRSQNGSSTDGEPAPIIDERDREVPPVLKRVESLQDVSEKWEEVLLELEKSAPRTLYFQLQRVDLEGLKGRELQLQTDNEFAKRLLEENQQIIATVLRKVLGSGFRITCRVVRNPDKGLDTASPYERFKQLQQKDPQLRTLVELFGAELEY